VQAIEIPGLIIVLIWFAFSGLDHSNSAWWAIVWAIVGGITFQVALVISGSWVNDLLMYCCQASIALNGIYVLSAMRGIIIGFGCCFLVYKLSPLGGQAWHLFKRQGN
jgi:hypothetical protein